MIRDVRLTLAFPALLALSALLSACSGGQGALPAVVTAKPVRVTVTVSLPISITTRRTSRPLYVSNNTKDARVTVTQGSSHASSTIPCSSTSQSCRGTVDAPTGLDTFTIELVDARGDILSTGMTTQTISSSSKTLNLTANPVVAAVLLSATPPYLSSQGPTRSDVLVSLQDPSGATIVGPGLLVPSTNPQCRPTVQKPCLVVSIVDTDTSGATTLSPTRFTSASDVNAAVLTLTGKLSPPPFDDPYIAVAARGVPFVRGVDVPLEPQIQWVNNLTGDGVVTSLAGDYATVGGFGGPAWVVSQCCSTGSIVCPTSAGSNDPPSLGLLTTGTSDGKLWFYQDYGDPGSGTPNEIVNCKPPSYGQPQTAITPTYKISRMIAGGDGNLWFAQSAALVVGTIAVASPTTATTISLPNHSNASIASLVRGSGTTVVAVVSDGARVWLDSITNHTVSEVEANRPIPGVSIAGYSPKNGTVYVIDASSAHTLWIVGQNGNSGPRGATGVKPFGATQPMAVLARDGSLLYVGSFAGISNVVVHIVPGRPPAPFSIVYGATGPCNVPSYTCMMDGNWYIGPDGSTVTTDGGNIHALVWN